MAAHDDNSIADAELIEACAEYTRLDAAFVQFLDEHADDVDVPAYRGDGEQRTLLGRVCSLRATTLAGIAARIETLAQFSPDALDPDDPENSAFSDARMTAALLRDLHAMLSGGFV